MLRVLQANGYKVSDGTGTPISDGVHDGPLIYLPSHDHSGINDPSGRSDPPSR